MTARHPPTDFEAHPFHVPASAVHLVPSEVTTIAQLRELVGFDQLVAEHPDHELFVIVFKTVPDCPFAAVVRVRKDVVHIQGRGLPIEVDPATRVVVVYPPNKVPIGDGRVG